MFSDLFKAVVNTVTLPVAVVADVVTMGGVLSDKEQPYTATQAQEILKNIINAGK